MSKSKAEILESLDDFTTAYIECALWSSTECDEDGDLGDSLDTNYGPEDITLPTLREMVRDCKAFQKYHAADLANLDESQAGHDFWLTRNGHGTGFWDRGLGAIGERLSDAARVYGSVDLMVHRGKVFS
jgi:hypothetical protein